MKVDYILDLAYKYVYIYNYIFDNHDYRHPTIMEIQFGIGNYENHRDVASLGEKTFQ